MKTVYATIKIDRPASVIKGVKAKSNDTVLRTDAVKDKLVKVKA